MVSPAIDDVDEPSLNLGEIISWNVLECFTDKWSGLGVANLSCMLLRAVSRSLSGVMTRTRVSCSVGFQICPSGTGSGDKHCSSLMPHGHPAGKWGLRSVCGSIVIPVSTTLWFTV